MVPRLAIYGAISTGAFGLVIGSALRTRPNFFSAAVAVGRSSGALMVLANFALFNAIWVGVVFKTIFFGQLRNTEYEHLFEKLWLFLTESLLALTLFKEDFSAPFAVMYGVLLFLKCFHWITADRVDYMDQIPPPGPPLLFHIRTTLVIGILSLADLILVTYSLESILLDGVSAMVLFASEFMILLASIGGTWARYIIGLIDLRRARGRADAPSWEAKSMYLFYVDLAVDFAKLLTYLSFFAVILLYQGLPLHILRDVYMTLRSFLSRVSDLIRYRRATKDMDAQYPNAAHAELERMGDKTCIICREEMVALDSPPPADAPPGGAGASGGGGGGPNETPKKLACGHIFHFHCLRSWLERQQSCPTCRRDVLSAPTLPTAARQRGRPPPPAPGAAPQPGAPRAQPPNPIQAIYDQYFRPPPPAPAAAAPAPTPAPAAALPASSAPPTVAAVTSGAAVPGPTAAPAPMPNGHAAPPPPASAAGTSGAGRTEVEKMQNGIWGGPITPGRFFPAPLGAAPQWPPSSSSHSHSHAHRPPSQMPPISSSRPINHTAGASPPIATHSLPDESGPLASSGSSTYSDTTPMTPGVSRAPEVFSSLSVPYPSAQAIPDTLAPLGSYEAANGSVEQEVDQRRAAAEAAMRRLGLIPPPTSSLAPSSSLDSAGTGVVKGKGRATADAEENEGNYIPYLTAPSSLLVNGGGRGHTWGGGATPSTSLEAARALDERIRALREVDEVVWGLVGDLTRMRSEWEVQDEAAGDSALPEHAAQ